MNLPAFCIRRPAFTIVISLVMMIIGVLSFMNLPIRWIPDVNPPTVSISTQYPGANASLVEHDVTKPIEEVLSGVSGIEMLNSSSSQGESGIYITFRLGTNMDAAVEDIRSSLERVRDTLPKDVTSPVVAKSNRNDRPILYIAFNDNHRSARELSDYIDKLVVPNFETLDGVGSVLAYGKRVSAVRVALDPGKMASANVTVDEVAQLLREQNASIPAGQIRGQDRYYTVVMDTSLKSIEQFNNLIIRDNQNQTLRLKDIGEATIEAKDTDSAFRINGKAGVVLAITAQSNANPLDVEKKVKLAFNDLKRTLPAGMKANIVFNQADYIRASIHSVYESFIEAIIFVWIVIFAFLCRFRATWVPLITIPVCLISAFTILYVMGFSINTISLMAFVLAIGLVVDDAIVMLENINRHIEAGMPAFDAALLGSKEMIFPIIAMTITLAAVYAPIAFTPGLLGVLFREFTFTLAGAVIISGVVALTLTPMMCAYVIPAKAGNHPLFLLKYQHWVNTNLLKLQQHYQHLLAQAIQKRHWVVILLIITALLGLSLFHFLPSELAPAEDMGQVYVSMNAPQSASFTYTDHYARQLEPVFAKTEGIDAYLSMLFGPTSSFQFLKLKPVGERKQSTSDIVAALSDELKILPGVNVHVFAPMPPLAHFANSTSGDNVGMVIMTTRDYSELQASVQRIMDDIRKNPAFIHVDNDLKWDTEQFYITVDRERAADLKVPIANITNTISTLLAGRSIGKMDNADVLVKLNENALANPNILQNLYVRNLDNNVIPLSNLVSIRAASAPQMFNHYDRLRADTIYISLAPNFKMDEAIKSLEKIAQDNLSDEMKFTFTGEAKSFLESAGKTLFTFTLALIFIYLVLVAQFESFIDPFIILLTVPFAMIGSIITLKLFGGSLNIYSNIGLITLIGLVAKHGILITEFANRIRAAGKSTQEAVIEAAMLRLRPILMTTAAMVLGALPLAVAFGPGAESRQQVGLVIAGGLLFGTLFSLIVVPIAYTYLAPFRRIIIASCPVGDEAIQRGV